ncbi:hypothetical protein GE21DRAFT_1967 [Neurospora crassa]|uniref:Uncharacterized protein n=1 Tax=Neurospora crassa (strain ATCC 24698 / 74-OR23-1A / CBS 708.71 / DSM 1257 / FGSC 987) TaxID=367110 RepID=Q7SED1_NEUCR|nr:hypothetical protein NCU00747 [Neurospora crassa OR74A]EAA35164.1 hypothetical protein NCU00747 [Neurospora crassa OR74A]KHE89696.1 hypothetical protein GE21DRAFT_1967 [Neurospora crassa]|eukprot:XP_964400.1 hypothetical protein NCU00747 [Neurospora crassa OR74A]
MLPNTQNPSVQEVREVHEFDGNSSAKGPSTPRAFNNYSSSWISSSPATATTTISSPSLIPSPSSSAAAATAQKQQLQPLNVAHPVISNFVVAETDASFLGYTTPTGATEGVLSVRSPSPPPSPSVSKPQTRPEPDFELEAGESKSGAIPIGKTTAQVTAGQDTVMAILITPRARDADFAQREKQEEEEEEKEAEEAAKKNKIRRQTAASYSVCAKWLREQMEDSGRADIRRRRRG